MQLWIYLSEYVVSSNFAADFTGISAKLKLFAKNKFFAY